MAEAAKALMDDEKLTQLSSEDLGLGELGLGAWFLVVYAWVYPRIGDVLTQQPLISQHFFLRFSPCLFFFGFGRYSLFLDNSRKRFGEVSGVSEFWR